MRIKIKFFGKHVTIIIPCGAKKEDEEGRQAFLCLCILPMGFVIKANKATIINIDTNIIFKVRIFLLISGNCTMQNLMVLMRY